MDILEQDFSTNIIAKYAEFEQSLGKKTQHLVHQKRLEAFETLKSLQIPTPKHEEWKYTNLKELAKKPLNRAVLEKEQIFPQDLSRYLPDTESTQANILVFFNGSLLVSASKIVSENIVLKNVQDAENDIYFGGYFGKLAPTENNYFNALNTAYTSEGVYLCIKGNKVVQEPILVYQILDNTQDEHISQVRNLIIAEPNSQATFVEIHITMGDKKAFFNEVTEIFVGKSAILDTYKIQNENASVYHISTVETHQDDKSNFSMTTLSLNGGIVRNNLNVRIGGEYCETYMNGLSLVEGKTHIDHHTLADHQKPNSYSNELYKGIFDGQSTGVFNGKIFVQPDAQKTNAYQQNRNILLTNEASINAKPQLEIWADDVKCSHGATTGQLDADALFYMQARGIPALEAKKLLVKAFIGEITERIKPEILKTYVENIVEGRLQAK